MMKSPASCRLSVPLATDRSGATRSKCCAAAIGSQAVMQLAALTDCTWPTPGIGGSSGNTRNLPFAITRMETVKVGFWRDCCRSKQKSSDRSQSDGARQSSPKLTITHLHSQWVDVENQKRAPDRGIQTPQYCLCGRRLPDSITFTRSPLGSRSRS